MKSVQLSAEHLPSPLDGRELSPAQLQQRRGAAVRKGIYRTRTGIPSADRKRLARYERALLGVLTWAQESDAYTIRSFARVLLLQDKIVAELGERGIVQDNGEPRRLVGELRQTLQLGLSFASALGLTPQARAALGVSVAKMGDLAELMAGGHDGD